MLLDLKKLIKKYHLNIRGVIHVGAYIGEEYPLYRELSIDNLAFFEPQEDLFGQLRDIIDDSENIKLYNIALGNETGSKKMYIDSYN